MCREIEGLLRFRNVIHSSEGFDREDEKVLTTTIREKQQALGEHVTKVREVIERSEKERVNDAISHMEVQLSNRIKVLEMGEKQFDLAEARCPQMYQYFIRKQVVLLKKLNDIKKSFGIDPSQAIHRTPGASIRERHPEQKLPLPRQKKLHVEIPPADQDKSESDLADLLLNSIASQSQ